MSDSQSDLVSQEDLVSQSDLVSLIVISVSQAFSISFSFFSFRSDCIEFDFKEISYFVLLYRRKGLKNLVDKIELLYIRKTKCCSDHFFCFCGIITLHLPINMKYENGGK